jgi:foldase protein PrsA
LLLALACLTACSRRVDLPPGVLALVGQSTITVEQFQERFATATAGGLVTLPANPVAEAAVRRAFLQNLIDETLTVQDAAARGLVVTREEIENEIRVMYTGWPVETFKRRAGDPAALFAKVRLALLGERIALALDGDQPAIADEQAKQYFEANADEFIIPEQIHLRQIVCADRARATAALTDLLTGGNFAEIAKETSLAPEAARGGDLGFVARGELLTQIEEAAFALPIGEISSLVESPFGVHVLQVLEKVPAATLTFQQAQSKIERTLRRRRSQQVWRRHLSRLREQAAPLIDWSRLPAPEEEENGA